MIPWEYDSYHVSLSYNENEPSLCLHYKNKKRVRMYVCYFTFMYKVGGMRFGIPIDPKGVIPSRSYPCFAPSHGRYLSQKK